MSWYYPPEEWRPLEQWYGETSRILDKLFERASGTAGSKFMSQSNQEYTARRFQSFNIQSVPPPPPGYDNGYECELPADVRTELVEPRRPRILGRNTQSRLNPATKWPLYLVVLIAVVIVRGVATTWRQEWTAERAKTSKAITQPLAPQPTPTPITPAPAPGPARSWQEYLAQHPEQFSYRNAAPRAELVKPAPRAALVKLPAPRAQLVHDLPPLIPGRRYLAAMPYNIEALATYKGQLASLDMFAIKRQPYRRHVGC